MITTSSILRTLLHAHDEAAPIVSRCCNEQPASGASQGEAARIEGVIADDRSISGNGRRVVGTNEARCDLGLIETRSSNKQRSADACRIMKRCPIYLSLSASP